MSTESTSMRALPEIGYVGQVKGGVMRRRKTAVREKAKPNRKVSAPTVQYLRWLGLSVWRNIPNAETKNAIAPRAKTKPRGWVYGGGIGRLAGFNVQPEGSVS